MMGLSGKDMVTPVRARIAVTPRARSMGWQPMFGFGNAGPLLAGHCPWLACSAVASAGDAAPAIFGDAGRSDQ